jgi:translation initiation factor IF-3
MFNASAALFRIFVVPTEQSTLRFARHSPSLFSYTHTAGKLTTPQRRFFGPPETKAKLPRDDEIDSPSIVLVGEDGKLGEPRSTKDLLASIDRRASSLVVVALGQAGRPPICKIVDKQAQRKAQKAVAKSKRSPAATVKTLELNWAIDGHDLGHRLKRVAEFLDKGNKVEIMIAAKKKGRKASQDEALELIRKIKDTIKGVDGAKESKPMEGKLLGMATMCVDGRPI